jgi:hypothetical protein
VSLVPLVPVVFLESIICFVYFVYQRNILYHMEELVLKSLKVSDDTHKELTKLGTWGESMDDIIRRLIKSYKDKERFKPHTA